MLYYAIQNKYNKRLLSYTETTREGKPKHIMADELKPPLLIGHSKGLVEFHWKKNGCDNHKFKIIEVEI